MPVQPDRDPPAAAVSSALAEVVPTATTRPPRSRAASASRQAASGISYH